MRIKDRSNKNQVTATFTFTEIEESTRLSQHLDEMSGLVARHAQILHEAIEQFNGVVFQTMWDSLCTAFHSAVDARQAAQYTQRSLVYEPWQPVPLKVRMGIHTGTAQQQVGSKEYADSD